MTPAEQSDSPAPEQRPLLRIVRGDASPEEIAAIVAVLAAAGSGALPAKPGRRGAWASPARGVRPQHAHGTGGWRTSNLPR